MSGTSNWRTIRNKRVGNDRARIDRAREAMLAELQLAPIRKRRKQSQAAVAAKLTVSQSSVSQLERGEGDMRLSTLAGYIGALGGHIEMTAVFDDETIPIAGFGKFNVSKPRRAKRAASVPAQGGGGRRAEKRVEG